MAVYQEDADGNLVLVVPDLTYNDVQEMAAQAKAKEELLAQKPAKTKSTAIEGEV